ncbi:MAG: 1-acyl-sn-glycerol-3-phosphate acyltransferase [Anaerolineales bacterium]|nr:1-acyl-sn-glycerol-3-phosphate acyltransferase [Anaerolineales bacterium]
MEKTIDSTTFPTQSSLAIDILRLRRLLLDEVIKALGLIKFGYLGRCLEPLFVPAVQRFAELAAGFDQEVSRSGFRQAARSVLSVFAEQVQVQLEAPLPEQGPLLVLSNHPGVIDSLVLASHLAREDLRIVASGVPFLRHLQTTSSYLIFSSQDPFERMRAVRSIIRHLQNGGSVLIFPAGKIEPDPAFMPGAAEELTKWSPSLEVIVRRVPKVQLVVTAVSGVLHPSWMRNPFVRLRRGRLNQQRTAEFLQVIQQMISPKSAKPSPRALIGSPFGFPPNFQFPVLPLILEQAKERLRLVTQMARR